MKYGVHTVIYKVHIWCNIQGTNTTGYLKYTIKSNTGVPNDGVIFRVIMV